MFANKLVAVINEKIAPGSAMNALAHMTIGLGASVNREMLQLDTYVDANGNKYPNISQMPFIILSGKNSKIRDLVFQLRTHGIAHGVFINTMTGGTYTEQLANTNNSPEENLEYWGAVMVGPWEKISELTRKFSLYK